MRSCIGNIRAFKPGLNRGSESDIFERWPAASVSPRQSLSCYKEGNMQRGINCLSHTSLSFRAIFDFLTSTVPR
jgi:hypothetical protein